MESDKGKGAEEMQVWPVRSAEGGPASAEVYLDHYVQQHSNEHLRDLMLSALVNMASIGVAGAAGGFVDAIDTSSAFPAAAGGPLMPECAHASLCDLANFASEQFRRKEEELVHGGGGVVKKRSRASHRARMQAVAVEDNAAAGDEDDCKGISEAMIGEMYHEIKNQDIKHRDCFKNVMRKYSKKYGVTDTSLRNILSFKNRRGDSSKFWNDDLWELYNELMRCGTCREELSKGSRVLCTHFGRGRPSAKKEHQEIVAARFRQSSAVPGKNKEGNNGLKRAYLVHIRLPEVWACLGCPDSKKYLASKGAPRAK